MRLLAFAAMAALVLIPLPACAQPAPAAAAPGTSREVTVGAGTQTLHGTFLDAGRPGPAVLIIAGSGPTDRNGDSTIPNVRPATYRLLAEGFAASGISSLRYDKRAIGASAAAAAREEDLRFSMYVDDAVAFARLLRAQHGVSCVVILGHSEGSLIGALAAARVPVCGLIEISGPGRPFGAVLGEQLRAANLPTDLSAASIHIMAELQAGRTVSDTPPALAALFRPSVQPYLISEWNIDPADAIRAVRVPTMIMQGDRDIQVSVVDAQRLRAARPEARVIILNGVNHVLKDAPADRSGNLATYADPNLPLAAGVMPPLVEFVRGLRPTP